MTSHRGGRPNRNKTIIQHLMIKHIVYIDMDNVLVDIKT